MESFDLELGQKFVRCTRALVALSRLSQSQDLVDVHLLRRHQALIFERNELNRHECDKWLQVVPEVPTLLPQPL